MENLQEKLLLFVNGTVNHLKYIIMVQPKKSAAKTAKEKKNIEDAKQMKNMRPTGPTSGRIKPSQGSAKNGKPVKKALLGSLLGGAAGGAGGSMLGGLGKQMLGGLANKALGGLMGGGAGGGRAAAQGGQGGQGQAPMPRKSTDMTPVRTRGMMKKGGKVSKAKSGTSLGMKSVKAGFDKNPGVTRADIITAATKKAKSGTKIKKAQDGDYLDSTELIPKAGAMLKTKVKERSPDGNYVKKTVTKTKKGATSKSTKTRRTVQGYLDGAPRVSEMKNGGKIKMVGKMTKCKYGCN
jgi:hypothetical protein